MSQGFGRTQRWLVSHIALCDEPMTFSVLLQRLDAVLARYRRERGPYTERSLRRALKGLVDERLIIPLGHGGPSDPHRYCINPMSVKSKRRRARLMRHLKPEGFSFDADGNLQVSLHSPHVHRLPR